LADRPSEGRYNKKYTYRDKRSINGRTERSGSALAELQWLMFIIFIIILFYFPDL
jgi:hypothetical protein